MKPNTSNKQAELEKEIYELCRDKWGIMIPYDIIHKTIQMGSKQGYAKALDDVKRWIHKFMEIDADKVGEQLIAKLSHSQQSKTNVVIGDGNTGSQFGSNVSKARNFTADTHIPKETK